MSGYNILRIGNLIIIIIDLYSDMISTTWPFAEAIFRCKDIERYYVYKDNQYTMIDENFISNVLGGI